MIITCVWSALAQGMRLPSMKKFDKGVATCNVAFQPGCVGPSLEKYAAKMRKSVGRARTHFLGEYNQKLYNGLLGLSVVGVVIYRFLLKNKLLELAAWLFFLFLEVGRTLEP